MEFDGKTYQKDRDEKRLTTQFERILIELSDAEWHTLPELSASTGDPEASISARIRDLRKEKNGGYCVQSEYVRRGLWRYRYIDDGKKR